MMESWQDKVSFGADQKLLQFSLDEEVLRTVTTADI